MFVFERQGKDDWVERNAGREKSGVVAAAPVGSLGELPCLLIQLTSPLLCFLFCYIF